MIHPTAIIGPNVNVGQNVYIGPYSVIVGNTSIGDNSYISSHVSIGEPAQHSSEKYELNPHAIPGFSCNGIIEIGKKVVIREFTVIHQPIVSSTRIGDRCYIMNHSHIAHDCVLEEDVVFSAGSVLSGHVHIMNGANLGIGTLVHQFTTIGSYAMIAAGSVLVKDVPPLAKFIPGKPLGKNDYAIKKWDLEDTDGFKSYLILLWKAECREGRDCYVG